MPLAVARQWKSIRSGSAPNDLRVIPSRKSLFTFLARGKGNQNIAVLRQFLPGADQSIQFLNKTI